MFTSIDTAIEEMIQSNIDEQDFVCRLDSEQYTDQCVSDLQDDISELVVRLETIEARTSLLVLAQKEPSAESEEPRAVNQIDWILGERAGSTSIFAGYPTIDMLEQFVRSNLGTEEESKTMMIIMMTLATARNLINEKLEAES